MKASGDAAISRLINMRVLFFSMIGHAKSMLDDSFPVTLQHLEKLSVIFDQEAEANLLRLYGTPDV